MTPYYQDEKSTVYCADCLEVFPEIQGESFHSVITDPPYMVGAASQGDEKTKAGTWVDLMNASFWYREWMGQCWRVLQPDGYLVVFLNWRSVPILIKAACDAGIPVHSLAVWDKAWIGPSGPKQLRPTYEMIMFCGKPEAQIDNRSQSDIFRCQWNAKHSGQSEHPAQKPIPLLKEIVKLVTKPGNTVFDPFSGSGTTGVAAIQAGRNFVGIEGNPKHCETIKERVESALNPMKELL